ncbi:Lsr2 family DNA-binding protein [Streptomyces specialis]|uniref:Lsr2 family DNA-binding protein n=1 Tax=Streptomyces specialis TaxID=498367 RepID=UPI001F358D79|nr:histone-like nucleoid-structuring protein Lsr2 [Streptomyces specialis]
MRSGTLSGGDPLPEPVTRDREGISERERNRAVRRWAREQGYTVPDRGRVPMHVRHAYELSHRDDSVGKARAA